MTPEQLVTQKLEKLAQSLPDFHRLNLEELEQRTNVPQQTWATFIASNEYIRQLIHRKTGEDIEFAQRKALNALAKEAARGNVQAIKELNQLSGILNQANQKQIVTHHIPRPTTKEEEAHD